MDAIDNRLKHALGDRPNSEFILDPEGKIVRKRSWSNVETTRKDLEKLVGTVEKVTKASDVKIRLQVATKKDVPTGVVPRVSRSRMRALQFEAKTKGKDEKFLAKLRPEASSDLVSRGNGKLYLGFHLDPIYNAHWNNLAPPIKVKLTAPEGVKLSKTEWTGPKPKVESDGDPREVMIDVEGWDSGKPLKVEVTYYACIGDEQCLAMHQEYTLSNKSDRDGGSARGGGFAARPGGGRNREAMIQRLMGYDKNKDGKLSRNELPERMQRMFARMDQNNDGSVEKKELEQMFQRRPGGRPGGFPGGRPGRPGTPEAMLKRLLERDKNKDGKLSKEEAPDGFRRMFDRGDRNNDGQLDEGELKRMIERMGRGRNPRP